MVCSRPCRDSFLNLCIFFYRVQPLFISLGATSRRHFPFSDVLFRPLLAEGGHSILQCQCPLLRVKRTWLPHRKLSANDPFDTSRFRFGQDVCLEPTKPFEQLVVSLNVFCKSFWRTLEQPRLYRAPELLGGSLREKQSPRCSICGEPVIGRARVRQNRPKLPLKSYNKLKGPLRRAFLMGYPGYCSATLVLMPKQCQISP